MLCFFATDLHGRIDRYEKLWRAAETEMPQAVFLGGDLLPSGTMDFVSSDADSDDFVSGYLAAGFWKLRERLKAKYPQIFLILGNDDRRLEEEAILALAARGLWVYVHNRCCEFSRYQVLGYAFVPPTPFLLKDWERYDVSRYVPPGCVSPEEGLRSVPTPAHAVKFATIQHDLEQLAASVTLERSILLFHTPPHETKLDRVANDGKKVDHVPLDLNVGSIAVRRFIEQHQPLLTLHGHVHESVRLTGDWKDRIGRTRLFGGAHDGTELALVRFDPENLDAATRELL
ncbi:MAG: metallophosphoesterase [Acidobacteriota bacterium]|nr:MAG: metallophosphoesterase [Acidobacteriota bacterium]